MHISEFFCLPRHATVLTGKTFKHEQSKTMFGWLSVNTHCIVLFACLPLLLPLTVCSLLSVWRSDQLHCPNIYQPWSWQPQRWTLYIPLKCHAIHKLTLINLFISIYKILKDQKIHWIYDCNHFLLHSNHRNVSATHMAIFKAMTT
jgi:hypothetical protein